MKSLRFVAFMLVFLLTFSVISACKKDKEDKKQTDQAKDALKALDTENQKNRQGQGIANVPPQVTIVAPPTGTVVTTSPLEVSWTSTDQNGDKLGSKVSFRQVSDAPTGESNPAMLFTTPDPQKFSLDVSKLQAGNYEVSVLVTDGSLSNIAFTRFSKQ